MLARGAVDNPEPVAVSVVRGFASRTGQHNYGAAAWSLVSEHIGYYKAHVSDKLRVGPLGHTVDRDHDGQKDAIAGQEQQPQGAVAS